MARDLRRAVPSDFEVMKASHSALGIVRSLQRLSGGSKVNATTARIEVSYVQSAFMEIGAMARGLKKETGGSGFGGAPRFVDVTLDPKQKKAFASLSYDAAGVVSALVEIVNDGHRVGISYAEEQQAYFVSLTGRDDGCVNKGLCMTSFARTALQAMALAVYKHVTVCGGAWSNSPTPEGEDFG